LSEQLARHPRIDASDIEVGVENGEVTLTGTVSDRQSKRMAEDIAENVYGVSDVQNRIRISSPT
jgi:osmotically-inducible protein OsmY